jgi:hypothetical protein
MQKKLMVVAALAAAFAMGYLTRGVVPGEPVAFAQGSASQSGASQSGRVFELRTYTAADGKLDLLHARFRNHTGKFFQRHGMTPVFYGKTLDAPLSQNAMVYVLSYPSREAAKKSWDAFRMDQEWAAVAKESGVGPVKIDSVYFEGTDYSPMK